MIDETHFTIGIKMNSSNPNPITIEISKQEARRHWIIWFFIWLYIVSGALEAGWPIWFSFWTQTPYVFSYALTFYLTLYKVAPYLHSNKGQFVGRIIGVSLLYNTIYMILNRIIPEYEGDPYPMPEINVYNEIADTVVMLIFIYIPAFGLYYTKYAIAQIRASSQKEISMASMREQLAQNELKFLKSQFMDHLTYNTLHHIHSKVIEDDDTSKAVLMLSDILRYNSNKGSSKTISVCEEIKHIQDFITIHKTLDPRLNINFAVHGQCADYFILPRVLITLVENAIKHGIGNDPDFPITIELSLDENITIKVLNKKRKSQNKVNGHLGLEIMHQMLTIFYGDDFDINIESDEEVYQIQLVVKTSKKHLINQPTLLSTTIS